MNGDWGNSSFASAGLTVEQTKLSVAAKRQTKSGANFHSRRSGF
jgi:hypothetical protein